MELSSGCHIRRRGRSRQSRRESVHSARSHLRSSTVVACAMLVPKLAVMAWYGVDLNGRRRLRRVKGFSRMPSNPILRCSVRRITVSVGHPGREPGAPRGVANLLRAIQTSERCAQLQPRSGDLRPNLVVLAGCYSLLFRRRGAERARISAAQVDPFGFFSCISAKTPTASARQ